MNTIRLTAIALALTIISAANAQETLLPIAPEVRLAPGEDAMLEFAVGPDLLAQRPALRLLARLDRETLGGSTYALRLRVNDQAIGADRLLNKPLEGRIYAGMILPWFGQGSFRVVYSPDYEAANQPDVGMAFVGGKAYEFVIAVADLLGEGANTLRLQHTESRIPQDLVISDIALVPTPEPLPPADEEIGAPPPTGDLPIIVPRPVEPVQYRVEPLERGGFTIVAGDQRVVVRSAFSWPNVGWNRLDAQAGDQEETEWAPICEPTPDGGHKVRAAGASYELERTVSPHADHVEVADRIVNTSGVDLHVSLRHGIALAGLPEPRIHLHGTELLLPSGSFRGGDNPSALVSAGGWGFGMLAEDDVLRAQCSQVADPELGEVGLLDHFLMIPASEEYTLRWSVYVISGGDYFDFVNAVRRNWGTNFTIGGPFAFVPHPFYRETLVPNLGAWLDFTDVHVVSQQIPRTAERALAHGLAFIEATEEQQRLKAQADLIRELRPEVKVVCYIDTYITSLDSAPERYLDARHLGPDSEQLTYPGGTWEGTFWQFVPTTENDYGRAMAGYFDLCLDELGYDGIYWDQLSHPGQPVAYGMFDGHSAIPDIATMTVRERVALIPLISLGFQEQQTRRVLDAGGVLIGNSEPETATMTALHFPRFVEAWHPSRLVDAHLYCPLGLGSPDRIQSEDDIARNIRDHLLWGGLWYYYLNWNRVQLTRPTITAHMFPFTPIELHAGYLIGEERILTAKSGFFGWGDTSAHRVFVYDEVGRLQEDFVAPQRTIDGATCTELRLPGGWLAAIERVH